MTTDTIMIRVDAEKIRALLASRPEARGLPPDEALEHLLASLQRQIEEEIREFEKGNGCFESCLYASL